MNFAELIENLPESILSTRPKLDAPGRYNVKVIEASYGANQAKTGFRGVLKLEVLDGDKATALTNVYLTVGKDEAQSARNIKPFYDTLVNLGVKKEKIIDAEDTSTWLEVIQSIISQHTKLITRGIEAKYSLVLKEDIKRSTDEKKEYFKNVYVFQDEVASEPTNKVSDAPAKTVKAQKVSKKLEATPEAVGINAVVEAKVAKTVEAEDDDMSWIDE